MNDAQLVEACLEGDHRAYTVLVNRYRYPVFGLCLSYVKDFDAAEDAAQEALVAAYLKLESLPEPQKFGPWLRTIAANQCRMWFRRQRRQVAFDEEMAVVDPAPSAAEQVLVRERRQRVLAAVSRLSRLQQQAVVLFYLEGLSLKRIAAFLNVAVPTVEQRLYRARRHLKEEMTTMVKENLQEHRLPEDFTREVVQEALARGRHLLQERQWPEARKAFNRIAAAVPDHLEAHRGLALAFDGETREALRQDAHFSDGHLLDNTFTALHKVCELGSDDPEIARPLGRLYSHYGTPRGRRPMPRKGRRPPRRLAAQRAVVQNGHLRLLPRPLHWTRRPYGSLRALPPPRPPTRAHRLATAPPLRALAALRDEHGLRAFGIEPRSL